MAEGIVALRAAGVALILNCSGTALPRVLHWGADLGDLTEAGLAAIALASVPGAGANTVDQPEPVSIVPEAGAGWTGSPGLSGSRSGRDWSPRFVQRSVEASASSVQVQSIDATAALGLEIRIEMLPAGLVRLRAELRNDHADLHYDLDALMLALPVPAAATELLDLTGRHCRERTPQRQPFHQGARVRDGRRGRTGADATLLLCAGEPGFGFRSGQVWAVHTAWSGNHRTYAERMPDSSAVIGGGELLLPGEIRLPAGETYRTPWLYASYGVGLDDVSGRFHATVRRNRPVGSRPVILNTWEAVYFDHDLDRLTGLADVGARVGVERFVLDDGWFRGRRDDYAGLGDWFVDDTVWPDGLAPLVSHVRALGMQFGLWVEPEMVNFDSDLARAHPDWILAAGGRLPLEARHQQVLDLSNTDAWKYILERLDDLVGTYALDYLKWDHNRDLVDAGSAPGGEPAVHNHTLAVYRLLDELRCRHPGLEIESCSSGGARIDLGIVQRTDRVWASDNNDALERQSIQRWTELLLPPEMIGAHVGPPAAHTTGRTHSTSFRAGTALFGHFGIEWDLTTATESELAELTGWVALYKRFRGLLHSGRVVRADHPDPAFLLHGVVAQDDSEALVALVSVGMSLSAPAGRFTVPGLNPSFDYRLEPLPPGHLPLGIDFPRQPAWFDAGELTMSGAALEHVGVQTPIFFPEQLLLLHAVRA